MTVTIAALQEAVAKELGVEKVGFDAKSGKFMCRCGRCGQMEVSGGTVQGLYEQHQLERLKKVHDNKVLKREGVIARGTNFKQPPEEVLKWLFEAKVDISDVYRLRVLKRNGGDSAEVGLWLFCRNDKGYRYVGPDGKPARKSVKMICKELPKFIEDEYGYPMEQYGDETELPGE